jgi:electron transfer flavoprotein beta subunit
MTNVLVCIKRVPDTGGEITLAQDAMSIDTRYVGHTVSPHEECAVELAIQTAKATDGEATVLSLGSADSLEQIRDALAVGCTGAVLIEAEAERFGPADVAQAIAEVVRAHEKDGRTYDLVLLGNDAADTGDFQVGIRLAYALGRPVVAGVSTIEVDGDRVVARADGADGTDIFDVELPAVLTVMEGGIAPRYPSIPGRMKAKRVTVETVTPTGEPAGSGRVRLKLPPTQPSQVEILGEGPEAAVAVVDLLERLGVSR